MKGLMATGEKGIVELMTTTHAGMLEWTAAGEGLRFASIVHHTDADREFAYDRDSAIDKALDEATDKGWTVVDMKSDWNVVFAE